MDQQYSAIVGLEHITKCFSCLPLVLICANRHRSMIVCQSSFRHCLNSTSCKKF